VEAIAFGVARILGQAFILTTAVIALVSLMWLWHTRRAWAVFFFVVFASPIASASYNFISHRLKYEQLQELCNQSLNNAASFRPVQGVESIYIAPFHKLNALFGAGFSKPNVPTDLGMPDQVTRAWKTPALRFDIERQKLSVLRRADRDGYDFIETEQSDGKILITRPKPLTSIRELQEAEAETAGTTPVSKYAVAERAFVPTEGEWSGIRGYEMVAFDLQTRAVVARQTDYAFWHPSFWANASNRHCVNNGDGLFDFHRFAHKFLIPQAKPSDDSRPTRAR